MARAKARKPRARVARSSGELPVIPCALRAVPIGACVQIESCCDMGAVAFDPACRICSPGDLWFIVTGRIDTDVMLRALTSTPDDPAWQAGSSRDAFLLRPDAPVRSVAWPFCERADAEAVIDPVSKAADDDGDLFRRYAWDRDA